MKKHLRLFSAIVCVLLVFASACAEGSNSEASRDYETAMFAAIDRWDEMKHQYDALMTEQQRFVCMNFTDAIQYAREGNFAMIDAINACSSYDDFVALLNGGVIDPNNPCVPEEEIINQIRAIIKEAGYSQPECIYVLHLTTGGDTWYAECGHRGPWTDPDGDIFIQNIIEYKVELSGENHVLTLFTTPDRIVDSQITVRY